MYTLDKLEAMPISDRERLYKNCLRSPGQAADAIIAMLEDAAARGFAYLTNSRIPADHPLCRRLEMIVNRAASEPLMVASVAGGRSPLEALDPLISAELGADYGAHNGTTILAGKLIGQRLYAMGYEWVGSIPIPGCVAKSGATFRKRVGTQIV
jgi:hypothetical protein